MEKQFKWRLGRYLFVLHIGKLLFNLWIFRQIKYDKSKYVIERLKGKGGNITKVMGVLFIDGKVHCVLHLYFHYGQMADRFAKGLSLGISFNKDMSEGEQAKGWYRNFFVKPVLEKKFK